MELRPVSRFFHLHIFSAVFSIFFSLSLSVFPFCFLTFCAGNLQNVRGIHRIGSAARLRSLHAALPDCLHFPFEIFFRRNLSVKRENGFFHIFRRCVFFALSRFAEIRNYDNSGVVPSHRGCDLPLDCLFISPLFFPPSVDISGGEMPIKFVLCLVFLVFFFSSRLLCSWLAASPSSGSLTPNRSAIFHTLRLLAGNIQPRGDIRGVARRNRRYTFALYVYTDE